jgi:Uncharacterized conserved protein
MAVVSAVMVPHPPIIIPEIGHGEERKIAATTEAYGEAARFVAQTKPETLVITTPHSTAYADRFHISPGGTAKGSFAAFGAPGVKFTAEYDTSFVTALCEAARKSGVPADTSGERDNALDHGTMIPLYFLQKAYGFDKLPPIVRIGLSGCTLAEHYRLGMLISSVADRLGRRVAVIASGDLSHRLKSDGPYGFTPEGPQYDDRIMNLMGAGDFGGLFGFGDNFCDAAGECGHRSFTIMAGALDGRAVKAQRLSYEDTFGVGYGVCTFDPGMIDAARRYLDRTAEREPASVNEHAQTEDDYIKLARLSVETYVREGKRASMPQELPAELTSRRAGVFVSLHIRGHLRGCIGTIEPTTKNVALEILQNGVSACSRDPRFPEVDAGELPFLEYSVDVLGEAEEITSPAQLDVGRYGVIVENGFRRGLLLPDLEGVDTVEEQVDIARRKAGIGKHDPVTLKRFEVVRHA